MIKLNIQNETSPLISVVLRTAESFGGKPYYKEAFDPKSKEHILAGTYPEEDDLIPELKSFRDILMKYDVNVYRPESIHDYNQIFARDIGFVIDDYFILPNIIVYRKVEQEGIDYIIHQLPKKKVLRPPKKVRIEGGDVMPWNGKIFCGYSEEKDFNLLQVSRTNPAGIEYLQSIFKDFEIIPIELNKSDEDAHKNALHLDCCFQPIGKEQAIIHKPGFKKEDDYKNLVHFFGKENIIEINAEEMYQMYSNIFSISPDVIVSEINFTRLNQELEKRGFTVEKVSFSETAKMEGLLRCSTLPLERT